MSFESPIVLKPLSVFSANGRLEGTVAAYEQDTMRYLVEVHSPNWSAVKSRQVAIDELVRWTERSEETVAKAVNEMMRQARGAEAKSREAELNAPPPIQKLHELPAVYVVGQPMRESVDSCWNAIKAANRPEPIFFNRNGEMAELRQNDEKCKRRRETVPLGRPI